MITCGQCGRFVTVKTVFTDYMNDDIRLVLATCKRHGEVAAVWTDYGELVDESVPSRGPWTHDPLPVPRGLSAA